MLETMSVFGWNIHVYVVNIYWSTFIVFPLFLEIKIKLKIQGKTQMVVLTASLCLIDPEARSTPRQMRPRQTGVVFSSTTLAVLARCPRALTDSKLTKMTGGKEFKYTNTST